MSEGVIWKASCALKQVVIAEILTSFLSNADPRFKPSKNLDIKGC